MSDDKRTKESVRYTDHANNPHERCGKCVHFRPLYQKCSEVKGSINPRGWCELWKKRR